MLYTEASMNYSVNENSGPQKIVHLARDYKKDADSCFKQIDTVPIEGKAVC